MPVKSVQISAAVVTVVATVLVIAFLVHSPHGIEREKRETTHADKAQQRDVSDLRAFSFDDIYSSDFSYSTFSPNWISSTEYIYRDSDGIKIYNMEDKTDTLLVDDALYRSSGANGYSISADQQYFLARTSYFKQWRHSYNGSYTVYKIATSQVVFGPTSNDIQHIEWSPTGSSLLWIKENNIHYRSDVEDSTTGFQLTTDGEKNKILNGVPDWVYEEEMVFSKDNIFWSPNSKYIGYLITDDKLVPHIQFSMYKEEHYPETIDVAYPKAGNTNPKVRLTVYNTETIFAYGSLVPDELSSEDHLFSRLWWFPDGESYLIYWLNRVSNRAVVQRCQFPSFGSLMDCTVIEAGGEETDSGWIGDEGGIPFAPVLLSILQSKFYSVFSNEDGFWNAAVVDFEHDTRQFLTTGTQVVTNLENYDEINDYLYFMAAYPLPRNRHLMRIKVSEAEVTPLSPDDWTCITCDIDETRCGWISSTFGPDMKYLVINCGGPDVPISYLIEMNADGTYGAPQVMEDNADVVANKAQIKWPVKEYGSFQSTSDIEILYQIHKPLDFDENKKYPLLIEVYGGPGYQKVQDRWTRSWAPIHMVSTYDIIVVSLDARGSAFRGNDIMQLVYMKLGQFEKEDTNEVAQYFADKKFIDESRIGVWGWSYGGYTTSFTISLGSGLFKCGIAVAPLASRFYYDTIHTERFMRTPDQNPTGYDKCSILNSELSNFGKSWYSIIHGTADDNVHFQNAALITKALIDADVDFDDFFYADEAHSVNTGPNANRHIYKLLTRKTRQCFDLMPYSNQAEEEKLAIKTKLTMKAKNLHSHKTSSPESHGVSEIINFKNEEPPYRA